MGILESYFLDVGERELLSQKEEVELSKKIKSGCEKSRSIFIEHNLRLVFKIASEYKGYGVDLMDLISEGNIGLSVAVDKFDHTKKNKFSTYACFWIKQRIIRYINNTSKTIRLPVYLYPLLKRVREARENFLDINGVEPTKKDLSKITKISEQKIKQIFPHTQAPLSIDMKVGENGNDTIGDSVTSNLPSALQYALNNESVSLIEEGLNCLNKREKYIIEHRFGLAGNRKKTLEEIGKKFKLTRERIRQVEKIALKKLKSFLSKKMT